MVYLSVHFMGCTSHTQWGFWYTGSQSPSSHRMFSGHQWGLGKSLDRGITGGYQDGTYRLENQDTGAEMAVFLVKTFNLPLP